MRSRILLLFVFLLLLANVSAENLEVSPLILKTSTKVNVAAEDFVKVKNLGVDTESIRITTKSPDFKLASYGFGLLPEEEKELRFAFSSGIPGVFTNEFFIRSETSTVVLPVIVDVESPNARFDSTVDTLDAKRVFYPGDEVLFSFTVFDLLEFVDADVDMEFYVLNLENELIEHDEAMVNVKVQKTSSRRLQLPDDVTPGTYILVVSSKYNGLTAFSSLVFNVVKKPAPILVFDPKELCLGLVSGCLDSGVCIGIIISVAFLIFAFLFIYIFEVVKLSKLPKKKIERAIRREEHKNKKLNLRKKILQEAEELRKKKEQEKLEEAEIKKKVEEMLANKTKKRPTITEKKLFEREIKKAIEIRKKFLKENKTALKWKKKVEKFLSHKK